VVGHVKQAIAALPEASADDDAIMTALQVRCLTTRDADGPEMYTATQHASHFAMLPQP